MSATRDAAAADPPQPCGSCLVSQCRPGTSGQGDARTPVGLSYIDLLYAVPVAVLAEVLSKQRLSEVSAGGWANVAVALTAVTCGWVGHHRNRFKLPLCLKQQEERWFFTTPRFLQFILEILIIGIYFALVVITHLPNPATSGAPSELRHAQWLALGFWLYLFWDFLDIYIAGWPGRARAGRCRQTESWSKRAVRGMFITLAGVVVFSALAGYLWNGHTLASSTIGFDAILILLLLSYRAAQELVCGGGLAARRAYR